jgi:hypothetical protein
MSTGRVYTTQLAATTLTQLYQVPTGFYGVYNVSFTNTATVPTTIRLAIAALSTPAASEYFEYSTTVIPNGVFERTGIVVQGGYYIFAYSSIGGGSGGSTTGPTNVNIYGIETSTS